MESKKQERWFITKFFCEKSEPSSKRLVGIVGSFTLFATLFANPAGDPCPLHICMSHTLCLGQDL